MQYRERAASILDEVIASLRKLDSLTLATNSHRLDVFEPLIARLEGILADLRNDTKFSAAIKKSNELVSIMVGGLSGLNHPKYRSMLASILGRYQRQGTPPKAQLGGLRGGRPRKDGKPVQTLESKGYSVETLPPKKFGKTRVHPKYRPMSVRKSAGKTSRL
jgi:hypothetical protein